MEPFLRQLASRPNAAAQQLSALNGTDGFADTIDIQNLIDALNNISGISIYLLNQLPSASNRYSVIDWFNWILTRKLTMEFFERKLSMIGLLFLG